MDNHSLGATVPRAGYRRFPALTLGLLTLVGVLASPCLAEENPAGRSLRVTASVFGAAAGPLEISLFAEPAKPSPTDSPAVAFSVSVPGETEIAVPFTGGVRLRIDSEDYWTPPVLADHGVDAVSLNLVPLVALTLRPLLESGAGPLSDVKVRFVATADEKQPRDLDIEGERDCSSPEQVIRCLLPAVPLDVKIEFQGFAPIYLWGVDPGSQEGLQLGEVILVPGASISGFLIDENGGLQAGATLTAKVPTDLRRERGKARGLALIGQTSSSNDRGFFQLTGLSPGTYAIKAEKKGFAPTTGSELITVRGDAEEVLTDPLILQRPGELELLLDPPRDPAGKPWQVRLFSPAAGPASSFSGPAVDGGWSQTGVEPGPYLLLVTAADGARWFGEEISVESGRQTRQVEIPVLSVVGKVSRGGVSAVGRLTFTSKKAGAEVKFWLDEEGLFEGYLPGPGRWELQFQDEAQDAVLLALEPIDIEPPSSSDPVEIEVEIPDTLLAGVVLDGQGRPEANAMVYLLKSSLLANSSLGVDERGEFEIRGLAEGEQEIFAGAPDGRSSLPQWVDLLEDRETPPVRLVLAELIDFEGQVLADDGQPIPGAGLLVWAPGQNGGFSPVIRVTAGATGEFSERVVPAARANILVRAPGFGTSILSHVLDGSSPLIVRLARDSGHLSLGLADLHLDPDRVEDFPPAVFLGLDGVFLPLGVVLRSMGLNPRSESVELPGMSPGNYSVCSFEVKTGGSQGLSIPAGSCQGGFLAPGSQMTLIAKVLRH